MSASESRIARLRAAIGLAESLAEFDDTDRNRIILFMRQTGAMISHASHTITLRCCGVAISSTSGQLKLGNWLERARAELKRITL